MKKYLIFLLAACLLLGWAGCSDGGTSPSPGGGYIDLSVMSGTVAYAEVYNIMTKPDSYMGKTIKMAGPYYASPDGTGENDHYVVIEDATACCQQGLEFVWNGDHVFPDDYPEDGTNVEVVGIFSSYVEEGQTNYCLEVDAITVVQ